MTSETTEEFDIMDQHKHVISACIKMSLGTVNPDVGRLVHSALNSPQSGDSLLFALDAQKAKALLCRRISRLTAFCVELDTTGSFTKENAFFLYKTVLLYRYIASKQ